jgi:hypothetical protein
MIISEPVQLAIIAGIVTITAAWLKRGQTQLHNLVNSRMTELLELTRKSSKAEGFKEGKEDVR